MKGVPWYHHNPNYLRETLISTNRLVRALFVSLLLAIRPTLQYASQPHRFRIAYPLLNLNRYKPLA